MNPTYLPIAYRNNIYKVLCTKIDGGCVTITVNVRAINSFQHYRNDVNSNAPCNVCYIAVGY